MELEKILKEFNEIEKEDGCGDWLQLKYQRVELHANNKVLKFDVSHFKILADYYICAGSNRYAEPLKKELDRLYNLYLKDVSGTVITVPLKRGDGSTADLITAPVLDEPDNNGNGTISLPYGDGSEYSFSVFDQRRA